MFGCSSGWLLRRCAIFSAIAATYFFFISLHKGNAACKHYLASVLLFKDAVAICERRIARARRSTILMVFVSRLRTETTTSFISPPKQPALPRIAPPSVPGKPPAHSSPDNDPCAANVRRSRHQHAGTGLDLVPFARKVLMSGRSTSPHHPVSPISKFVPPDKINILSFRFFASRTAQTTSFLVLCIEKKSGGAADFIVAILRKWIYFLEISAWSFAENARQKTKTAAPPRTRFIEKRRKVLGGAAVVTSSSI